MNNGSAVINVLFVFFSQSFHHAKFASFKKKHYFWANFPFAPNRLLEVVYILLFYKMRILFVFNE